MIIANRNLQRISVLSLAAVLMLFGGCRWFSAGPVPLTYSRVATMNGLADIGEPFGTAFKDNVLYVSDGVAGTIRRIDADGRKSRRIERWEKRGS